MFLVFFCLQLELWSRASLLFSTHWVRFFQLGTVEVRQLSSVLSLAWVTWGGNYWASDRQQTDDVLGSEMSLVDVSDAVFRPKYLKMVRCTSLNVTERSSRWFTAAIRDSFFCSMMSPLQTDRCVSGHISASRCIILGTVFAFLLEQCVPSW